jgi:hypothetical protein
MASNLMAIAQDTLQVLGRYVIGLSRYKKRGLYAKIVAQTNRPIYREFSQIEWYEEIWVYIPCDENWNLILTHHPIQPPYILDILEPFQQRANLFLDGSDLPRCESICPFEVLASYFECLKVGLKMR